MWPILNWDHWGQIAWARFLKAVLFVFSRDWLYAVSETGISLLDCARPVLGVTICPRWLNQSEVCCCLGSVFIKFILVSFNCSPARWHGCRIHCGVVPINPCSHSGNQKTETHHTKTNRTESSESSQVIWRCSFIKSKGQIWKLIQAGAKSICSFSTFS